LSSLKIITLLAVLMVGAGFHFTRETRLPPQPLAEVARAAAARAPTVHAPTARVPIAEPGRFKRTRWGKAPPERSPAEIQRSVLVAETMKARQDDERRFIRETLKLSDAEISELERIHAAFQENFRGRPEKLASTEATMLLREREESISRLLGSDRYPVYREFTREQTRLVREKLAAAASH
jgi:hypothetical protein